MSCSTLLSALQNENNKYKDIAALSILLCLVFLFYYPKVNPLSSRYVYYADSFERAAKYVNNNYSSGLFNRFNWNNTDSGLFNRFNWEQYAPLHTLLARYSLLIFRNNLANAVILLHLGSALAAAALIFIANRYYFSVFSSFFISLFLLFGRVFLPIVRCLGNLSVLFAIPVLIIFLRNLAKTQDRSRHWKKQLIPMTLLAVSIAVIYSLGGHETIFSILFLFGFFFLLILEGIIKNRKREKRFLQRFTFFSKAGLVIGAILILALFAQVRSGIHLDQQPASIPNMLSYKLFMNAMITKTIKEPRIAIKNRYALFLSTFVEGRWRKDLIIQSLHKNTFLYAGEGFNGIIPLFILPGFLIGLVGLVKDLVLLFKPGLNEKMPRSKKYFVIFNVVLLGLFLSVMLLAGRPKPTRYTLFIYAIFALSFSGYEKVMEVIKNVARKWRAQNSDSRPPLIIRPLLSFMAIAFVPVLISGFTVKQLTKNYRDLQTYFQVYDYEIPSLAIAPVLAAARSEHASKTVFIIHPKAYHPGVGMLLGFKAMKNNVILISKQRLDLKEGYNKPWKQWILWKRWKKEHDIPKPPNVVFYIWDKKTKAFNIQYSEEA